MLNWKKIYFHADCPSKHYDDFLLESSVYTKCNNNEVKMTHSRQINTLDYNSVDKDGADLV